MSTPHNEANLGDIAKTVIMPGDPLRAQYIAENFLTNVKLVNQVRGIYAYTGLYKGKEVSIMASGMGMPSMAIYSYELYKFYNVENIIRIGSCGAYKPELKLFDIVLSKGVYSESNYSLTFNNDNCHFVNSSIELNKVIQETAIRLKTNIYCANTVCLDCFAKYFNKNASCLMTVVDSKFIKDIATVEQRQTGLKNMIEIALESSLNL